MREGRRKGKREEDEGGGQRKKRKTKRGGRRGGREGKREGKRKEGEEGVGEKRGKKEGEEEAGRKGRGKEEKEGGKRQKGGQYFSDPMDKLPRDGIVLFTSHSCSCTEHAFHVYIQPTSSTSAHPGSQVLTGVPLPGVGCMTLMLCYFLSLF